MPHPFANAHVLVANAKRRTEDLIDQLIAFREPLGASASNFYDDETEAPYGLLGIQFSEPVPAEMQVATRDVLNDLRAALDYVGYACAAVRKVEPKKTHFPFAKHKKDLENQVKSACRDIPAEIVEAMISWGPHDDEGGNRFLYALNAVRNVNAHRLLQPMARGAFMVGGEMSSQLGWEVLRNHKPDDPPILMHPQLFWPPVLMTSGQLIVAKYDTRVSEPPKLNHQIFVTFGEAGVLTGQVPVHVFRQMIPMVETIIANVEWRAASLGLFGDWRA